MRNKKTNAALLILSAFTIFVPVANAMYEAPESDVKPTVHVGRYSTVVAEASSGQRDLLQTIVQTRLHQRIITVGDAMEYILLRSGYRIANESSTGPAMQILLSRPLPEVHRRLGPMTLEEALMTLAGPVYSLVVDPLNRLLTFEVVDKYRPLVSGQALKEVDAEKSTARKTVSSLNSPVAESVKKTDKAYRYRNNHQVTQSQVDVYQQDKSEALQAYEGEQSAKKDVDVYGPVLEADTSYAIARQFAKNRGVSTGRMLYAIVQENPAAFGHLEGRPNINLLYQNTFLEIPSDASLAEVEEQDALQMIAKHNQAWQSR